MLASSSCACFQVEKASWSLAKTALCVRAGVPGKSPKEAVVECSVQFQQGTLSVLEIPVLWNDHQEQHQQRRGASQSLRDKLCVPQRAELEK